MPIYYKENGILKKMSAVYVKNNGVVQRSKVKGLVGGKVVDFISYGQPTMGVRTVETVHVVFNKDMTTGTDGEVKSSYGYISLAFQPLSIVSITPNSSNAIINYFSVPSEVSYNHHAFAMYTVTPIQKTEHSTTSREYIHDAGAIPPKDDDTHSYMFIEYRYDSNGKRVEVWLETTKTSYTYWDYDFGAEIVYMK